MSLAQRMMWARKIAPGFFRQHGSNAALAGRSPLTGKLFSTPLPPAPVSPQMSDGPAVAAAAETSDSKLPVPEAMSGAGNFGSAARAASGLASQREASHQEGSANLA